ncbi:MAG TPA: DUF3151 domain-containing protein, partial [Egibacteraceae bacterium]|nr:DUF3151 domain-containing protein [Egibacteraceae bacterium]
MSDERLPLSDTPETLLEPDPAEAGQARRDLSEALAAPAGDRVALGRRLADVARAHPTFLDVWAHLAAWALDAGDTVAAYAFARTGYHRGLDMVRKAGWRGQGPVPWRHQPNQGFLRSVHELMRAAAAIGEFDEAQRCRQFLLQLDPGDPLGVCDVDVA